MDTVTFAITLPVDGTAFDYQSAIVAAIQSSQGFQAQQALCALLRHIQTPLPAHFNPGHERTALVYGKIG